MIIWTIVSWLKEVGDEIKKGDNLVEIETEKVVNEFESPESGILLKKIAEVNIKLNVGSLIGILGEKIVDDNSINQFIEEFQSNFQNQSISKEDDIDLNKKIWFSTNFNNIFIEIIIFVYTFIFCFR